MDLLGQIGRYLFAQSWQIAVLAIVVALVCRCLQSRSSHVRYLLWLIVLAKCLSPALFTVPVVVLPHEPAVSGSVVPPSCPVPTPARQTATVEPAGGAIEYGMLPGPTIMERLGAVTARQWLCVVWLAGVLAYGVVTAVRAIRMHICLRRRRGPLPTDLAGEVQDLYATLKLKTRPRIWAMPDIGQPFVWGLWRGAIFLPADFARLEARAHRHQVLAHEICHVMRFDAVVNLLQILAQTILWFHPAVWWMNHRIRVEREKCCDEMAIAQLRARPQDYSKAIVNVLIAERDTRMAVSSLAITGPVKAIEERIRTIMKPNKRFSRRPGRAVALGVLALALVAVPTSIALARRASNIEVTGVRFEPMRQGKNVVHVDVKNTSDKTQTFAVHVQTRSPDLGGHGIGWGRGFFTAVEGAGTQTLRCAFHVWGDVVPETWVRLKFYNPASEEAYDFDEDFETRRYTGSELPVAGKAESRSVSAEQREQVAALFRQFQDDLRARKYEQAWNLLSADHRHAAQIQTLERFVERMEPARGFHMFYWGREELLALSPKSVGRSDAGVHLIASRPEEEWTITFVRIGKEWKIDWIGGYVPWVVRTRSWEERTLPKMKQRKTDHFDIYYFPDSTAARQIDEIVRRREDAFTGLCELLKANSDIRIRVVLFEDKASKHKTTGHQGAGWAFGNTIVEVYNDQERLDPYHETAHIVMGQFGNPPAMFDEGFAVYMQEGHRWNGQPVDRTAARLIGEDKLVPLVALLGRTEIGSRADDGEVAYPQSASFVGFLLERYGQDKFLKVYGALKRSDDAKVHRENLGVVERTYGKDLVQLEREWKAGLSG
ncbi:MAG: M56 family metallopeptidase [Planctomycetota bacterium]|jgi:beta-lactamase regulating signal transducer with metallopeptidase domain